MSDERPEDETIAHARTVTREMENYALGGTKNRRRISRLNVLMVIVMALTVLSIVQAFNAASTARTAKAEELSTFQSCLNRNAQDVGQIGLWHYVIELTKDHHLETLQQYANTIFAERQCITGPPAPTIVYKYHTIKPQIVRVGHGVVISDRKCVPMPVHVFASVVWIETSPQRLVLPERTKSEELEAGCELHNHRDAMPRDVIAAARAQFNASAPASTWIVSGTETPAPSNMDIVTWSTPKFTIVP